MALCAVTLLLYSINQRVKTSISNDAVRWFMCCYFNDIIGSITFASYTDLMMGLKKKALDALWKIELLLLCCGFFWEVITPLFRKNTVADIWDIAAYLFGGFLYHCITKEITSGAN